MTRFEKFLLIVAFLADVATIAGFIIALLR